MKKSKITDTLGKKYGRLTVLFFVGIKKVQQKDRIRNKYIVHCRCECGQELDVNISSLKDGQVSCGCFRKEQVKIGHEKQRGKPRPNVQKPNGYSILHSSFLTYKNAAKQRGITFKLSENQFEEITAKNCYYCNSEPVEKKKKREFTSRKLNGIDRIDSSIGYEFNNCVPCCKKCNYIKHIMSYDEMINHIMIILECHDKRQKEIRG